MSLVASKMLVYAGRRMDAFIGAPPVRAGLAPVAPGSGASTRPGGEVATRGGNG